MYTKHFWNERTLKILKDLYPTTPSGDIADLIGCSSTTVRNKAHQLGLKKDPSFHNINFFGRYTHQQGTRKPRNDGKKKV